MPELTPLSGLRFGPASMQASEVGAHPREPLSVPSGNAVLGLSYRSLRVDARQAPQGSHHAAADDPDLLR